MSTLSHLPTTKLSHEASLSQPGDSFGSMNQPPDPSLLAAACTRDLGDPDLWHRPDGYPRSLALCIVDSIYSTGIRYGTVVKVVDRYIAYRRDSGADALTDGTPELLATFDELGGAEAWAEQIGTKNKVSTSRGAPFKAEAVQAVAQALYGQGINTADDFRAVASSNEAETLKSIWTATPGQRSGLTWNYAQMLAQIPNVKADRMVERYVARALGVETATLNRGDAEREVAQLAAAKGWDLIQLDHAIWRFESGRPVEVSND